MSLTIGNVSNYNDSWGVGSPAYTCCKCVMLPSVGVPYRDLCHHKVHTTNVRSDDSHFLKPLEYVKTGVRHRLSVVDRPKYLSHYLASSKGHLNVRLSTRPLHTVTKTALAQSITVFRKLHTKSIPGYQSEGYFCGRRAYLCPRDCCPT